MKEWSPARAVRQLTESLFAAAHDGGTRGSASSLFVLPDAGVAMIALANQGLTLWRMIRIARSKPDIILNEIVATAGTGPKD